MYQTEDEEECERRFIEGYLEKLLWYLLVLTAAQYFKGNSKEINLYATIKCEVGGLKPFYYFSTYLLDWMNCRMKSVGLEVKWRILAGGSLHGAGLLRITRDHVWDQTREDDCEDYFKSSEEELKEWKELSERLKRVPCLRKVLKPPRVIVVDTCKVELDDVETSCDLERELPKEYSGCLSGGKGCDKSLFEKFERYLKEACPDLAQRIVYGEYFSQTTDIIIYAGCFERTVENFFEKVIPTLMHEFIHYVQHRLYLTNFPYLEVLGVPIRVPLRKVFRSVPYVYRPYEREAYAKQCRLTETILDSNCRGILLTPGGVLMWKNNVIMMNDVMILKRGPKKGQWVKFLF